MQVDHERQAPAPEITAGPDDEVPELTEEEAVLEAFGAERAPLPAALSTEAARIAARKYHDPAWHAGPWDSLTPPGVRAVLGATSR